MTLGLGVALTRVHVEPTSSRDAADAVADRAPDTEISSSGLLDPTLVAFAGVMPDGVSVGRIDTLVDEGGISIVARIRNTRDEPLAPSEVMFDVIDGDGDVLADYSTIVVLDVGETKTVGVEDLTVPSTDVAPTGIRVSVNTHRRDVADAGISVDAVAFDAEADGSRTVRGVVVNPSVHPVIAVVSCAVRDRTDRLTDVVVDSLSIAAGEHRRFEMDIDPGGHAVVACGAS
jgi:hypothetical protein